MVEFCTDLPEEIAGWVSDAARRLDVTRSEIVQRAVEHYLGHFDEVRVAFEQRQQQRGPGVDWEQARKTLEKANCPYDNCPYAGDCPADVCPL